jgi:hypothetical protein
MNDQFRKHLECPICLEVRRGCKIFQCKNGHGTCEECYNNLGTCSVCRVGLTHPGIRNLLVEQLIGSLPHQCKHVDAGCLFETSGGYERLNNHEVECLYKPVACPQTNCDKKMPVAQLEDHVISQHKPNILDCSSEGMITVEWPANIGLPFNQWKLTLFRCNGLMLFPTLVKKDNVYYAWLAAASLHQSNVDIILKGEKGGHYYTGQTLGMDTSNDYVTRNPDHILTFSNANAKQCMTKNDQGIFVIKVTFKMIGKHCDVESNDMFVAALTSTVDKMKGKL